MKFIFNGQIHEDMWRERGSSEDYDWSLDLLNYDTEEVVVKGVRLRQSEMSIAEGEIYFEDEVEEYVEDWLRKLGEYLGAKPNGFREMVTASLHDRYKAMLLEAGAEIIG